MAVGLLEQLGYPVPAARVARRIERLRASEADKLLVAEVGDAVIGLVLVHVSLGVEDDRPAAKLGALVVDEAHRRRGIGEALVAAAEDEARRRGCRLLFLTSAERRRDAHAFYLRLGFRETGRRFAKPLD